VDAFLNEAETLVMRRGQRMTRIRRKVLRLLLESSMQPDVPPTVMVPASAVVITTSGVASFVAMA